MDIESATPGLPLITYLLAAGTFLMGTTEFLIAGLLPGIAAGFGVSVARAGLSITVFAAHDRRCPRDGACHPSAAPARHSHPRAGGVHSLS